MKKLLSSAAIVLAAISAHAQQDINTAQDPLRYSTDNLTGTARFRAMAGAFGAVGGDPSAININPAGSAIYNYNSGTFTLSSYNMNNAANYFGDRTTKNGNGFDLNQLGMFFVFNNGKEDAIMNKFTLGINYENTKSFNNTMRLAGVNPTGSITDYFLRYANGIGNEGGINLGYLNGSSIYDYPNMNFIDQQAYLGYNAYAINPVTDASDNTQYVANLPEGSANHYQESYISTSGYNGKVALNFAAQLKKRLYVGANVNIHFTDYINRTSFYEDTNNTTGEGLQALQLDTKRYTYGGGASLNVGAILKVAEPVRIGLAYESPTWLRLQDEITQVVRSTAGGQDYYTNPGVTMVGDDYGIRTPSKYTGSAAFIFGKAGLISVDYGMRNYGNTRYTSNRYNALNAELSNNLDWAGDLRVGTEWRVKMVSIRGGYRYQQSPYKNGNTIGDLNSISGGLGYSFGGSRLDLAYTWQQQKNNISLFTPGLTDAAQVKTTSNNITLSYTLDL
ncbi:transporter [Flavobacterium sp. RHBU_3]|uniref:transporter n=1 Tax=Flavobacterium sp. RHBU_3 TaxID=3391184 RepID=UPI003984F958